MESDALTPATLNWMQYRTAWHPMLVVMLSHTRPAGYTLSPEFLLGREPQRVDVVLVRAVDAPAVADEPAHLRTLWTDLPPHTLLHFTGPSDELERGDAAQLLAYACQYMLIAEVDAAVVGLRVLAPTLTPRFVDALRRLGGTLSPTAAPGVHEGTLGVFALRVVESAVVCGREGEHLLYAFTPEYVRAPQHIADLDPTEQRVFYALCQCVAQFRNDPKWSAIMKDAAKVTEVYGDMLEKFIELVPVERRLAGIAPAQRLAGLDPAQRLAGLDPAQRLVDVDPAHQILALSDEVLRGMPDSYLVTLPDDVVAQIRARIGRPLAPTP